MLLDFVDSVVAVLLLFPFASSVRSFSEAGAVGEAFGAFRRLVVCFFMVFTDGSSKVIPRPFGLHSAAEGERDTERKGGQHCGTSLGRLRHFRWCAWGVAGQAQRLGICALVHNLLTQANISTDRGLSSISRQRLAGDCRNPAGRFASP